MSVTSIGTTSSATWTTTPDPFTFTSSLFSAQREVAIVFIAQTGAATDQITSVSVGGVAATRVTDGFAVDSAGEAGAVYAYFVGSGLPVAATTTVSIDHTAAAQSKRAWVWAGDAAADTEIVASGKLEENQADPQIALDTGATEAMRLAVVFSGLANTSDLTPIAGFQDNAVVDFGQQVALTGRQTTVSTGSATAGWTAASDDIAMVAVAVAEVSGGGAPTAIPELVMAPHRPT